MWKISGKSRWEAWREVKRVLFSFQVSENSGLEKENVGDNGESESGPIFTRIW